jgi:predicted DNA-binding ribbon-helix-helix protein
MAWAESLPSSVRHCQSAIKLGRTPELLFEYPSLPKLAMHENFLTAKIHSYGAPKVGKRSTMEGNVKRAHLLDGIQPRPLKCMNVIVNGLRTSLKMEPNMWDALHEISRRERLPINDLCGLVADKLKELREHREETARILDGHEAPGESQGESGAKGQGPITLTAAIRVFIMNYFRRLAQGKASPHDGQSHHTTGADAAGSARSKLKDNPD